MGKNIKVDWTIHFILKPYEEAGCEMCYGESKDISPNREIDFDSFENIPYFRNAHTHGLVHNHRHKEICTTLNLNADVTKNILNSVAYQIAYEKLRLKPGLSDKVIKNFNVEILDFDDPKDPTLYIIFPDENGKLPKDKDCNEVYKTQYDFAKYIHEQNIEFGNPDP